MKLARRIALAAAFVALASATTGCTAGVPKAKPDVNGMVIDTLSTDEVIGVLIGAKTEDGVARQARAVVSVTPKTLLFDADGKRLKDGSALGLGDSVKVWYSGPVAESNPVRADARVLQITVDNP